MPTLPTCTLQITLRLLVVAVADPSQTVRMTVLETFSATHALDDYLAQVSRLVQRAALPCFIAAPCMATTRVGMSWTPFVTFCLLMSYKGGKGLPVPIALHVTLLT
jgi:hypothetical protein